MQCDAVNIVLASAGVTIPDELQKRYNDGVPDRTDWLLERVKLLSGLVALHVYCKAIQSLANTTGAVQLCRVLKRLGCRLAIVSSGCKLISEAANERLVMDYAFGNEFEVDCAGRFTGNVMISLADADRKADWSKCLLRRNGLKLNRL